MGESSTVGIRLEGGIAMADRVEGITRSGILVTANRDWPHRACRRSVVLRPRPPDEVILIGLPTCIDKVRSLEFSELKYSFNTPDA